MFLAFDTPVPFSTMGRRNVSNVPAQALTLMNDPLVVGQARLWAERVIRDTGRSDRDRLDDLLLRDRLRPPARPIDETRAAWRSSTVAEPGDRREPENRRGTDPRATSPGPTFAMC